MYNIISFITDIESRIHAASMKPIQCSELICISYLVFFSGIRKGEIGLLKVRDVIDGGTRARDVVEKFGKQLRLNNEAKMAVEKYYVEMREQRPWQAQRRKPFFPTFQDGKTLSRYWKKVSTGYNEIHEAGIKNHFASSRVESGGLGSLYIKGSEHSRITARQYQAVVNEKKIPNGIETHDARCIDTFMALLEEAEHLKAGRPTTKSSAIKILRDAQETVDRIRNVELQNEYRKLMQYLQKNLSKHIYSKIYIINEIF